MPVVTREGMPFSWSKDAQSRPWVARCHRENCFYCVSASAEEEGQIRLALHNCPTKGPTRFGLMMPRTLLEQSWEMLDELVDKIFDGDLPADEKRDLQNQAKGVAQVLAIFMQPHFEFPHEISLEARKRWQARKAGEPYETAGLGSRRTEPPPGDNKYQPIQQSQKVQRQSRSKPEPALTQANIDGIKNALAAGFTAEQLAPVYGVTPERIRQVGG